MSDAGKVPEEIDAILLVGGATRTPLVRETLESLMEQKPRQDVDPDLCVALGAGIQASRIAGHSIDRVLVDINPYSFGISYLGERDGELYPHCYHPIIHRNTPLPVTRTESYTTSRPFQTEVDVKIYQGDEPDALNNIPVGDFRISGLKSIEELNAILCKMSLDLDGILNVSAIEKATGLSKTITIDNALKPLDEAAVAAARQRLAGLFGEEEWDGAEMAESGEDEDESSPTEDEAMAKALILRAQERLDSMHGEDREEAIDIIEAIADAIANGDREEFDANVSELRELLFFIEGGQDAGPGASEWTP